ncbi:hypothetical protein ARSEF4850_004745 [Beauveria asiatica]
MPAGEPAIPYITAPSRDGVRCRTCQYITRDIRRIQRHCREQHGWVNDWKKGGNIKAKQQQPRSLPWTSGVWCQRLFRSRAARSWVEVQAVGEVQISIIPNGSIIYPGGEEKHDNTAAILAELDEWDDVKEQRVADGQATRRVEELDPKNAANSWLQRVGWTRHLEGLQVEELQQFAKDPDEDEALLQHMTEQCH